MEGSVLGAEWKVSDTGSVDMYILRQKANILQKKINAIKLKDYE
jgi:hypothetical protein